MRNIHVVSTNDQKLLFTQQGHLYDLNHLPDGFEINGNLILSDIKLKNLPDLSKVVIRGDFDCSFNELYSLEGAPNVIYGSFNCSHNKIRYMTGAPKEVGKNYNCSYNELIGLGRPNRNSYYAPTPFSQTVFNGDFNCSHNFLYDLDFDEKEIKGTFNCSHNSLESLKGSPKKVWKDYICSHNKLRNLAEFTTEIGRRFNCNANMIDEENVKQVAQEVSARIKTTYPIVFTLQESQGIRVISSQEKERD